MVKRPFLVWIVQKVPAYGGGTYESHRLSYACETEEEARTRSERSIANMNAQEYAVSPGVTATREHRAIFRKACEVCGISGVKPGCKKKKCEACGGVGSTGAEIAPFY